MIQSLCTKRNQFVKYAHNLHSSSVGFRPHHTMDRVKGRKLCVLLSYLTFLVGTITFIFIFTLSMQSFTGDNTIHTGKDRPFSVPKTPQKTVDKSIDKAVKKRKFLFVEIDPPTTEVTSTTSTTSTTTTSISTTWRTRPSTTSTTTWTTTTTTLESMTTTTEYRWGNTSLDDLKCLGAGGNPYAIGDMHCYGPNNNPDCKYDGYDCCLPIVDDRYCSDVMCRCNVFSFPQPSLISGNLMNLYVTS